MTPIPNRPLSKAPWKRAIRARTREWRAGAARATRACARSRRRGGPLKRLRSTVRAEVFEVK